VTGGDNEIYVGNKEIVLVGRMILKWIFKKWDVGA
jgi:hypothetical protein